MKKNINNDIYIWNEYKKSDVEIRLINKYRTLKFLRKFPLNIFSKYKYVTGNLQTVLIGIKK